MLGRQVLRHLLLKYLTLSGLRRLKLGKRRSQRRLAGPPTERGWLHFERHYFWQQSAKSYFKVSPDHLLPLMRFDLVENFE